jgi:predicted ribosome quality control (RQC) complex YloA/Tae2 family protein
VNIELIEKIIPELREALVGAIFRSVFQMGEGRFAIAFDGDEFHLLFVSIEPGDPRVYLIRRKLRELKKVSTHPSHFSITLEKAIAGSQVIDLDQVGNDRILEIALLRARPRARH